MRDEPTVLIRFSPAHRRLLVALAAAFVVLVALRVHGFSISAWRHVIDGSPAAEVLLGEAQVIRSDDWMVQLALALAQRAHDPPFPRVNENIGLGQNMLAPVPAPVAHPLTLFRPTLWGFFAGADVGLAWQWWTQTLGFFYVWFLVFSIATQNRFVLSVLGALIPLLSPFFQFWSLNAAPVAAYAGLVFVSAAGLATARRRGRIVASALLLGWSGACFGLVLYPPYQIALAYLLLALALGFAWDRRRELDLRQNGAARVAGGLLALGVIAAAALAFQRESGDAVERLLATTYPGDRIATGGDRPLWQLLSSDLWIALQVDDYGPLLNVCEASSFWLFFPVVGAGLLWRTLARRERSDPLAVALLVYCVAIAAYGALPIPRPLARLSLFGEMPAGRALLGLGLADALLLVRTLSTPGAARSEDRRPAAVGAALWSGLLAGCAFTLRDAIPELRLSTLLALAAANGALAYFILRRRFPAGVLAAIGGGLLLCTAWFNPVVVGGSAYLRENALSRKILEIDRAYGGESVWASFGSYQIADLFRTLGVRSINGTHTVPQLELWAEFDPSGRYRSIYNRYGHVSFVASKVAAPRFRLYSPDTILVDVDPKDPVVRALGVTHVLINTAAPTLFEELSGFERVFSADPYHVFRVPPQDSDS